MIIRKAVILNIPRLRKQWILRKNMEVKLRYKTQKDKELNIKKGGFIDFH